jgi:small GTP-binding protein
MNIQQGFRPSTPYVPEENLPARTINKKICLVGDFSVGKTSLAHRFLYNLYDERCLSTVGVKVNRKTVAVPFRDKIVELTMMLWDVGGTQHFHFMPTSYLRGVTGGVLVCDMTRPETLDSLRSYTRVLVQTNSRVKLVLAANKYDLVSQPQLVQKDVEQAAADLNSPYFMTSAKTGHGVDRLFRHLGRLLFA